jgi:hypothetical protein
MPRGPKGEKRPAADLTLILYRASKESAPARGAGWGRSLEVPRRKPARFLMWFRNPA